MNAKRWHTGQTVRHHVAKFLMGRGCPPLKVMKNKLASLEDEQGSGFVRNWDESWDRLSVAWCDVILILRHWISCLRLSVHGFDSRSLTYTTGKVDEWLTYRLDSQVLEISTERRHTGTVFAGTTVEDNSVVAFDGGVGAAVAGAGDAGVCVGGCCCSWWWRWRWYWWFWWDEMMWYDVMSWVYLTVYVSRHDFFDHSLSR